MKYLFSTICPLQQYVTITLVVTYSKNKTHADFFLLCSYGNTLQVLTDDFITTCMKESI